MTTENQPPIQPPGFEMLAYVVSALRRRKGQWREIAEASDVPYDTVSKIAREHSPEPGVLKIQRLARVLFAMDEAEKVVAASQQLPLQLAPVSR